VTDPIRVQESSDETDLFIGEISPPMLPKTLRADADLKRKRNNAAAIAAVASVEAQTVLAPDGVEVNTQVTDVVDAIQTAGYTAEVDHEVKKLVAKAG